MERELTVKKKTKGRSLVSVSESLLARVLAGGLSCNTRSILVCRSESSAVAACDCSEALSSAASMEVKAKKKNLWVADSLRKVSTVSK